MFRSLRLRFSLALVAVQVVMLAIIVWNSNSTFRHNYEHRLLDTAQNLAAQVAATSARYLFELDSARLDEYVNQTMSHDELRFLVVYDADGLRVSERGPIPDPSNFPETSDPHALSDGVLTVTQDVRNNGELLGRTVLGFSLELMEQSLSDARRQSIMLAAVLVLLTVLLSYLIGRALTRDLSAVSSAVADYGAGQTKLRSLNAATDEVQAVVDALSNMAGEREQSEKQRENISRFYRSLIEHSSDVVIVLSVDGTIRFAGPSVTRVLGYTSDALKGKPLIDLAATDHLMG
jgi:two-component system sensor histidine kinase EvgS